MHASWAFGIGFGQIGHDDIHPPRPDQSCDSDPDLTCQFENRNAPPAADGDHHMIVGHPHSGHFPAREIGHHATPAARAKIIDGRATADRRSDRVEVDTVDHSCHHTPLRGRNGPGHEIGRAHV